MSDGSGWVKIHRSMLDNPVVMKDSDHCMLWMLLLLNATHKPHDTLFGGKRITLMPGQLITGRKKLARELRVNEHKIDRMLRAFKNEQQIEQQSKPYGSLITIKNWHKYQDNEQQNEQRMSNQRATNEQRVSTKQECKECKEVVVDARARGSGGQLSDRLTDTEWHRLDRQFDHFLDLIDRIDDQVQDPYGIDNPYAYFLKAANNMDWPRK